jgi:vacuolar-type H+-ATPase subunit E/Vma4
MNGAATVPSPPRRRISRAERERAAIEASLRPVADAITQAARERAHATRAAAAAAARAELTRAREEAQGILAEARADGDAAAAATAAIQVTMARREAREMVLAARRAAYETLRERAVAALVEQAATPEGRRLAERLQRLVRDRVGASAAVRSGGPGNLRAVAESGNRRAELAPGALVDQALESLGAGIEALWA